jgi:type VI secretion system protein ImpG
MPDELLRYYETELQILDQLGREFAQQHRQQAARLYLEQEDERDPHVERLIQAVAFLTARVRQKLDDDYPELTEALLHVLYPHYLAPIPSLSLVQFVADPMQGKLTDGHRIERGTGLATDPVRGMPCRFRTCYPVTLWPLEIESAAFETPRGMANVRGAASVLRVGFHCTGGTKLEELKLRDLRLYIDGADAYRLYELLLNRVCGVEIRAAGGRPPVELRPDNLRPVGFDWDEGLLPYRNRSFVGFRLLQEFFCFPVKFLFLDVTGLEAAVSRLEGDRFELWIYVDQDPRIEQPLTKDTFRLAVAPVVNLFSTTAEPLRVDQAHSEYRLVPDLRREDAMEVYSVDAVRMVGEGPDPIPVEPFYAFRHTLERRDAQAFWCASRRPSTHKDDPGTEVFLSLVDAQQRSVLSVQTLGVQVTCTNRDLPASLTWDTDRFHLEGKAPLSRIHCLRKPTKSIYSHLRRETQWQLLSHLALNYLSLAGEGGEALRDILRLYNLDREQRGANEQQISGITTLTARRVVRRPRSMPWNGFCRGLEVAVGFNKDNFVAGGVFLMASVLEVFLGLYASINSFTQLVATVNDGREIVKQWPPRAGEQTLL